MTKIKYNASKKRRAIKGNMIKATNDIYDCKVHLDRICKAFDDETRPEVISIRKIIKRLDIEHSYMLYLHYEVT